MRDAVGARLKRLTKDSWLVSYARTWTEGFGWNEAHLTSPPADLASYVAALDILPEDQYVRGLGKWVDKHNGLLLVRSYYIELEK